MTHRLEIKISGDLPDDAKHAIVAEAETLVDELVAAWGKLHPEIDLTAAVKRIRPGRGKAAPTLTEVETPPPTRHAAE